MAGFLAAVRVATPLLLAATGETVVERAGVIKLGLEGMMLAGALAATLGAGMLHALLPGCSSSFRRWPWTCLISSS